MRPDALPDPRAYPALLATSTLALGIVAARSIPSLSPLVWTGFAAAFLLGFVAFSRVRTTAQPRLVALAQTALALVAVAALGAARTALLATPAPSDVSLVVPAAGVEGTLVGRVHDVPAATPGRLRFRLAVDSVQTVGAMRTASGLVQAALFPDDSLAALPALRHGERVRLDARLRPPRARRNPADFDYAAFLARQGIWTTATAYDADALAVGSSTLGPFGRLVQHIRAYAERTLHRFVPGSDAQALLAALVLGDRSGLGDATNAAFRNTGLLHLLAVSGLHVLLVGMLLYELLRGLLRRTRLSYRQVEIVRAVATLAVLVIYAALTGASASVVRAVAMAAVLILANLTQRPTSGMNALGVAAIVVLAVRPSQLVEPGFQLSFAAVAGLVVLRPVLEDAINARIGRGWKRSAWKREALGGMLATVAATLATLPVLLYHFGRLPFAGVVLNLVGVPLTTLTFAAALATLAVGGVPPLAAVFGAAAGVLADALVALAAWGNRTLAAFSFVHYETRTLALAATASALVTVAAWPYRRLRGRMLLSTLALAVATIAVDIRTGRSRPTLDLVAFDVGQGDALLVVTPQHKTLLVDAGPRDARTDAGEAVVLPHLQRFGIDRVDALVVTHPHADHAGGALALLQTGRVGALFHNGDDYDSDLWRETLAEARRQGVPVETLRAGDTLALDPEVRMQVLAPAETHAHPPETNDASIALRLAYGQTTALLLGDVQLQAEAEIVARYRDILSADVVKVSHHGSRTSSAPPLLTALRKPGCIAVVSVAERNRYGLPDEEVLARWQRTCPSVDVTSRTGAVWLRSNGQRFSDVAWR